MTIHSSGSDYQILLWAQRYVERVAEHRGADDGEQTRLEAEMESLLGAARLEIDAEKRRRRSGLAPDIRRLVRDRKPFDRIISAAEAEAVRRCYSTPPVVNLDALSGDDLILLGDMFEGWAYDKRLDQRMMIELLGWADGIRILAETVGAEYVPPPWPKDVKVPILKFLADGAREPRPK